MEKVEIYTDGSCYPNDGTGKGGWAFVVVVDDQEIYREIGTENPSTNNRMELSAIISAMEFCEREVFHNNIEIFTDSKYCKNGYKIWMSNWEGRGWKTSMGGEVKNKDLWKKMYENKGFKLSWIKGHEDNKWNIIVDKLASYKNN